MDDPLKSIFAKSFVAWGVLLTALILWPFDMFRSNQVYWLSDSNGIEFKGEGIVASPAPLPELFHNLRAGRGFTLELWLSAADTDRPGHARIMSYSLNTALRNYTLVQERKNLYWRLRTTKTNLNATDLYLVVENIFTSSDLLHIVITCDLNSQAVFINGKKRVQVEFPDGKFANWDPGYYLVLGNEATCDRPWKGKLFRAGIYNHPLSEHEIMTKYTDGWHSPTQPRGSQAEEGLLVCYLFNEGEGDIIHNSGFIGAEADLEKSRFLRRAAPSFLKWPHGNSRSVLRSQDAFLNVLAFIPFSFFLHGMLRNRFISTGMLSVFVFSTGVATSLAFESLQYFSITRHSTAVDLITNTIGVTIGIMIERVYYAYVKRH